MSDHLTAKPKEMIHEKSQWTRQVGPDQSPSFSMRGVAATVWKKPVLVWLFAACIPGLILGMAAFYSAVGPLENRLLELEARGVARDIDAMIDVRSAAVKIASRAIDVDDLSESGGLDNLLSSFRQAFPDFLSLEVLDEQGQVLAMVGELPLSQARRFAGESTARKIGAAEMSRDDTFVDDPEAGCFFVTALHKAEDGTPWFSRTRFSRDPIETILTPEGSRWTATLGKVSDVKAEGAKKGSAIFGTFGRWWGSTDTADAPLESSGYTVKLDKPSGKATLSKVPIIVVALILIGSVLAVLRRKLASTRGEGTPESMQIRPPHYRGSDVVTAPAPRRTVPRVPEYSLETGPCETVSREDADYDTWTPRNVPMGMDHLEDPPPYEPSEAPCNSIETFLPGSAWEHKTAAGTSEDVHGQREELDEAESPDLGLLDELPDTLDVTWFEPVDEQSRYTGSRDTDAHDYTPEAETRMLPVPDSLEIAWTEPDAEETGEQHADDAHEMPSRFHSA